MVLKWLYCRKRHKALQTFLLFGILLSIWLVTHYWVKNNAADGANTAGGKNDPEVVAELRTLKSSRKSIQPELETPSNSQQPKSLHSTGTTKTAKTSPRKSSPLADRFPRFMIIGFGKAGTRALYDLLRMHPKLDGPGAELRFFSAPDYSSKTPISKYLKQIPKPPSGGYTIEKSPDYITTPKAPMRIAKSAEKLGVESSELKFIVVLRDPVDRAMSEYLEWVALRRKNQGPQLPSFERMVWNESFPGNIDYSQPFINASCYAQHIRRWLKTFPREQCCFVDGDSFTKSPYQEVYKLERCLGLSHYFQVSNYVYNSSRRLYCFKVPGRKMLCGKNSKGRTHPEIPKKVLEKLRDYFKPWNAQLPELIGQSWRNYSSSYGIQ